MKQATQVWINASEAFAQLQEKPEAHWDVELAQMKLDQPTDQIVKKLIGWSKTNGAELENLVGSAWQETYPLNNSFKSGMVIDDYLLIEQIGQGGMAIVFKAERVNSTVQKKVAIKIFNHHQLSPKLMDGFNNEQEILARLNHPNIISMQHSGTTSEGVPYMVMDYVSGFQTIDQYIQHEQPSIRLIVELIKQVADAIAYAHSHLVVHRDLKPNNILIDENKTINIVDFGISRLLKADSIDPKSTTTFALTPDFAAPEQIAHNHISFQSDVFSLGAVLLSLLTKRQPFEPDRLIKQCAEDEKAIKKQLSQLSINQDLKNIINKALQSDPKRRYQSMNGMAEDLSYWLKNKPVKATADSWWYRLKKFCLRNTALSVSLATLFITVTAGVMALIWQFNQTLQESEKTRQVKDFMLQTYSVADPDFHQGLDLSAKDLLKNAKSLVINDQQLETEIRVEMIEALGVAYGQLGAYSEAVELLKQANQLSANSSNASYLAHFQMLATDWSEAENTLANNMKYMRQNQEDFARALRVQATLQSKQAKFTESDQTLIQLKSLEAISPEGQMANIVIESGVLFDQSEFDEAIDLLEKTIEQNKSQLRSTSSAMMNLKYELSDLYQQTGAKQKSLDLLDGLMADQAAILGQSHPSYLNSMLVKVSVLQSLGEIDQAKQLASQALEYVVDEYGENHLTTSKVLQVQGILDAAQGNYDVALTNLQKSAEIYKNRRGEDDPLYLEIMVDVANLMKIEGQPDDAFELLQWVYDKQSKILEPEHRSLIYSASILGPMQVERGNFEQGIALIKSAVDNALIELGEQHPETANALFSLGRAYSTAGQHDKAIETFLIFEEREIFSENDQRKPVFTRVVAKEYVLLGQLDQAEQYARMSLNLHLNMFGEEAVSTVRSKLYLAIVLAKNNKTESALDMVQAIEQQIAQQNIEEQSLNESLQELKAKLVTEN
ncbi:protein kinase [Marinicella sp. S1101]|uniref:serine/threonine-protein kinase n=1 Tax=Marinicella marina TaxID=2996016 RepID=UPI0022609275|nr:serine/threonine-protein kinase [Marinicella marina]MCX7555065.1 protein kinase [Marinicella marina]MDJ1141373.1 protein kinase [Marinicella marina]